uniref:cysteine dioxygenase n=2 Tax=Oryza sativa subsp. japonica TaxID=39947 RepID=Q6F2I1_ORYSJ|nr:putative HGWP repeat containing protein [Oryza sativa Japonica Group]AAT76347.1 putative HGWP repeat containing protein [Oryza sativa Japonica Group]ABF97288.1 hypothetical protein LOC_Os03g38310 [Oryza sativa Japonica Group]
MGVHIFTDRLAFAAADWCFRLHGWPIMPPLLGVYDFTAGLPPSPPTGALAYTVGWSYHRSWASTSSPAGWPSPPPTGVSAYTAGLLCRRWWTSSLSPSTAFVAADWNGISQNITTGLLSPPPTGVTACTAGLLCRCCWVSTSSLTGLPSSAADWCFRLHGWPIMPPLLGVYVFTDRPPHPPPTGISACTAGLLCHRCWASTSSPTGRFVCSRLEFPLARPAYYAAVVGHHRLHRPAASSIADWCFRLYGWLVTPPLLGIYVFIDRPPRPPPTDVSACTADLLCRRCWASTSSPTGRLVRRRLVFPPALLAYYASVVGRLRLHRQAASSAADWCFRLHGWPIMPSLLGIYVFTDRSLHMTPTDAIFFTAGYVVVTANRHRHLQRKLSTPAANWFIHFHGWMILPLVIGLIVFTTGRLVCC